MKLAIATTLLAILINTSAQAQSAAVSLLPMQGDKKVDVVNTQNFTGSCGSAVVRVMGVERIVGNFYTVDLDSAKIIIRSNAKDLILDEHSGALSDHNGIACLNTKSGQRLLVWSNCNGSACGNFSFTVIDPEKAIILAPKNPAKESCDEKCATKLTGSRLPQQVNKP